MQTRHATSSICFSKVSPKYARVPVLHKGPGSRSSRRRRAPQGSTSARRVALFCALAGPRLGARPLLRYAPPSRSEARDHLPTTTARGPRATFPTGGGSCVEREPSVEELDVVVKSLSTKCLQISICARGGRSEQVYRIPVPYARAEACSPGGAQHALQRRSSRGARKHSSLSAISIPAASHAPLSARHATPAQPREERDQRWPRLARQQVRPWRQQRG